MRRPNLCWSSQFCCNTWCKRSKENSLGPRKSQGNCQQELTWYSLLLILTDLPMFRAFLSQQHSQGNIISTINLFSWIQKPSTKSFIWLPYFPVSAAFWESRVLNLKFFLPFKLGQTQGVFVSLCIKFLIFQ